MTSQPSAFSALDGAVTQPAESSESPEALAGFTSPRHYGGFLREQRALDAGRAVVDLSGLGVLRLEGADRATLLHSLTSGFVQNLAAGQSAETLLLDPQGRIEHAFGVLEDGDGMWLLTAPDRAPGLADFLTRMRFMLDARIVSPAEDVRPIAWLARDGADPTLGLTEAAPTWVDPWGDPPEWSTTYRDDQGVSPAQWPLRIALVPASVHDELAARVRSGHTRAAGLDALNALRVAAWRPFVTAEVDARTIPHELDWMRTAVHLSKGCYRGQETVAKVHNLGRPPRRLTMLHLDGEAGLPPTGAMLRVRETGNAPGAAAEAPKPIGRITSVAMHMDEGPIALALLARGVPPDALLATETEDGSAVIATQVPIVSPESGRNVTVPRIPRLAQKR